MKLNKLMESSSNQSVFINLIVPRLEMCTTLTRQNLVCNSYSNLNVTGICCRSNYFNAIVTSKIRVHLQYCHIRFFNHKFLCQMHPRVL